MNFKTINKQLITDLEKLKHKLEEAGYDSTPMLQAVIDEVVTKVDPKRNDKIARSEKKARKKADKINSDKEKAKREINYNIKPKYLKGLNRCDLCEKEHLSCREFQTLLAGKVIICRRCKEIKIDKIHRDVMDHVVSGSYGSGKKSR